MDKIGKILFWVVLVALSAGFIVTSYYLRNSAEGEVSLQASSAREEARRIQGQVVLYSERLVPAGLPFQMLLRAVGIDAETAGRLAASAQSVFDLRHLRAGNRLDVGRSVLGELRSVRYRIDTDRVLSIAPQGNEVHSEIQTIPSEMQTIGVMGEVHGSLFEAVINGGEKPELAMRLAQIFGWDLDFYTDPRPGDTFRVVVEKKVLSNGELLSYGRILAAEYKNAGHPYGAVLFHDASGAPAYFTPEGKSMKKAFLHSPLKFAAAITSHFSNARFHPILKEYRPHLGIDYGAPSGTPVQTIGDGKVIFAGPKGGAGNLIQIKHTNGYETYYMHLSRILVRTGQRVEQGERIGLVGMTGLATGPHLDFRIENHGQFLNFEHLPLPPSDPVTKSDWAAFATARDHAVNLFPVPGTVVAQNPTAASSAAPKNPS